MKTVSASIPKVVAASLAFAIAACGPEQADQSIQSLVQQNPGRAAGLLSADDRVPEPPRVRPDWAGHKVGASPGEWFYAGKMVIAGKEEKASEPVLNPNAPSVPDATPGAFIVGDPATGEMHEVRMKEADQAKVAAILAAAGYNAPLRPANARQVNEEAIVEKGWSDGVDNRTSRGIGSYGVNAWPYQAIGQLKPNGTAMNADGHCTATFVGSAGDADTRYIVTAAHCFWNRTTGNYLDPDFWPRQDRCLTTQGAAINGCVQGPFGEWDGGVWTMYTYFTNNCTRDTSPWTTACMENDIAVLRVHRQAGATFPGAIGFGYFSTSDLNADSKYHRGYPNCNGAGDPVPTAPTVCLTRSLYGDDEFTIDSGSSVLNGWPRLYKFSSDSSPGHSGGPAYRYGTGSDVHAFGVNSTEDCNGSACSSARPNTLRAIDEGFYNVMMNFMGL